MTVGRINFNTAPPNEPWGAIDELRKPFVVDHGRPSNAFTVKQYLGKFPQLGSENTAKAELDRMVAAGSLQHKKALVNSRITNVYWIPEVKRCPEPTLTNGQTGKRRKGRISG